MPSTETFMAWKMESAHVRSIRQLQMAIVRYDQDDNPSFGEPLFPPNDPRHAEYTKYALYFRGEFVDDFRRMKYAQDHAEEMVMSRVNAPQWMAWRRDA